MESLYTGYAEEILHFDPMPFLISGSTRVKTKTDGGGGVSANTLLQRCTPSHFSVPKSPYIQLCYVIEPLCYDAYLNVNIIWAGFLAPRPVGPFPLVPPTPP